MKRGEFIKIISGGVVLLATGRKAQAATRRGAKQGRSLRFGVLTDTHYSDREVGGTRHYRDSLQKMLEAIDEFNRAEVDFIIELGDMKDMPKSADPAKTLADLDRIEAIFREFDGATYHALGNHDMDCISKEEFLAHTTNTGRAKGKSYYSFAARGVRCIVLDANFNADLTPYCRGNFKWTSAQIPPQQLEWLEAELAAHSNQPTLIFLHQLLDHFSGVNKNVCVSNAAEVVAIIERHPQVLAVFQGHHHPGHYSHRNGIHYVTLNGMIEKAAPAHNSFAIVELSPSGEITITGFRDCPSRKL
ncbi:MAG: metallophosphoesterase [Tidjanibacter sp.]|nr:metallophosphoesterase [Tidjanibacter sp.]